MNKQVNIPLKPRENVRMFEVFVDYGLTSETNLESFESLTEASRYAARYSRRNKGTYESIEVIEFAPNGEAITHWRKLKDDDND